MITKAQDKSGFSYVLIMLSAAVLSMNYYIFIIPNSFAPAGLNGIATMVQYKFGFSIGYMSLLINIPLCLTAYFVVDKVFAVRTLLFSGVYSVLIILLQNSGLERIRYYTNNNDTIYPVIISGVVSGTVYGICFKSNGSTGGTDIVSKYISKVRPKANFFLVIFTLNAVVAVTSLFVYSDSIVNYKPVALCITYCFISSFVGNYILKGIKSAYKFTIITPHPEAIQNEINSTIRHGVTKVEAIGTYTNTEKSILICVVNKAQLTDVQTIISKYDETFSFCELVSSTYGNFKKIK